MCPWGRMRRTPRYPGRLVLPFLNAVSLPTSGHRKMRNTKFYLFVPHVDTCRYSEKGRGCGTFS